MKTHYKKLNNPDYLGAYSLDNGSGYSELNVIIEQVFKGEVYNPSSNGKEECIIAKLKGQKPMILNATNCKTLAKLFDSPHIEDWCGKPVTIYVAKVKAFGDVHDALRIRNKFPELPELTPDHPKWSGAVKAIKDGNVTIDQIKKQYRISPENILKLQA